MIKINVKTVNKEEFFLLLLLLFMATFSLTNVMITTVDDHWNKKGGSVFLLSLEGGYDDRNHSKHRRIFKQNKTVVQFKYAEMHI